MRPNIPRLTGPALGLLLLVGCDRDPHVTVTGTATYDGKPIEVGEIILQPEDGVAPSAGGTIENGRYTLRVMPGAKKVWINASKLVPVGNARAKDFEPVSLIPPQYNYRTTLTLEVPPGTDTEANFDLKAPKP